MNNNCYPEKMQWSGILAISLFYFALICAEYMPGGFLPAISRDLNVSIGMAGQGITISAIFAVITGLTISKLSGLVDRRYLMIGAASLIIISNLMIVFATNYYIYILARAVIGIVLGGFLAMSPSIAMRLAPEDLVPRAISAFHCGNAFASLVAAPAMIYFGDKMGWRNYALISITPIGIMALIWLWIALPSMKITSSPAKSFEAIFSLLKHKFVVYGMLGCCIFTTGRYIMNIYQRVFLENAFGATSIHVSNAYFITGLGGFIGVAVIGFLIKGDFYKLLMAGPVIMIASILSYFLTKNIFVALGILFFWHLINKAVPVGWWSWIALKIPNNAEAGGGLMVAVVQLGVGLGGAIGGICYDMQGYQSAMIVACIILFISIFFTYIASKT